MPEQPLHRLAASRAARFTLFASALFFAPLALADEIKVMASAALKEAYLELLPGFEKSSGHKVATEWVGSANISKRIKAGEVVDVVVLARPAIEALTSDGKLAPGSRVDLAKSGVGVAVRAGAPRPDISSGAALRRALLAAKSISYSSGPSGAHIAALLVRMGIADEVKSRIRQTKPGDPVGAVIARGEAEIGFQQVSELLPIAGIDFLGPLPADVQGITLFSGALHTNAAAPRAAQALLEYLSAPAAAPVLRIKGMDPA